MRAGVMFALLALSPSPLLAQSPDDRFDAEMRRRCPGKMARWNAAGDSSLLQLQRSFLTTLSPLERHRVEDYAAEVPPPEPGWRGAYAAMETTIGALGLERRWADFICNFW